MALSNVHALTGTPNVNRNVKNAITFSCLFAWRITVKTACSISLLGTASEIQVETVTS